MSWCLPNFSFPSWLLPIQSAQNIFRFNIFNFSLQTCAFPGLSIRKWLLFSCSRKKPRSQSLVFLSFTPVSCISKITLVSHHQILPKICSRLIDGAIAPSTLPMMILHNLAPYIFLTTSQTSPSQSVLSKSGLLFLLQTGKLIPALEPLYLFFSLPECSSLLSSHAGSFSFFILQFKFHIFGEAFLDHLSKFGPLSLLVINYFFPSS